MIASADRACARRADLVKPEIAQIVPLQRHRRRGARPSNGEPGSAAQVHTSAKKHPQVGQPLHRRRAIISLASLRAALQCSGKLDRLGNERPHVCRPDLGAARRSRGSAGR